MSHIQLVVALTLLAVTLLPNTNAEKRLRPKQKITITDGNLPFNLNMRVCNAFTDEAPLTVVLQPDGHGNINLTNQAPLQYKSCRDLAVHLKHGDSLEFLKDGAQLGAFAVTSVPQYDATLLLIIHRKGTSSRPAFRSHIFSKTKNAQVAVLDMYTGPSRHSVVIQENKLNAEKGRQLSVLSEKLAYDSVVAVDHGNYYCSLTGVDRTKKSSLKTGRVPFTVNDGESYVAMRVGTAGNPGFPEELIVFPSSESRCLQLQSATLLAMMLLTLLPS